MRRNVDKTSEHRVIVRRVVRGRVSKLGGVSFKFTTEDHGTFETEADLRRAADVEADFQVGVDVWVPCVLVATPMGRVFGWKLTLDKRVSL